MKMLSEKKWDKFPAFGENGILYISATNSSIDAIRLLDGSDKSVPYITRSDTNNGLARFVSTQNYEFGSDSAGCITIGLDTQTAFYQPHKFVTGQNIQIVTCDALNKDVAHFLVTILREQMRAKFNWGGNGATLGRMKRLMVMLPVTDSNEPDYEYMVEFSRKKREVMIAKYKEFAEKQMTELEYNVIPTLTEKKWEDFSIIDIFDEFKPGKSPGLNHLTKTAKGISYVGATNRNNGVLCFVEENQFSKKLIQEGNCIGFIKNGDGSAGFAIYKSEPFISTSDVIYGYASWLNQYTGLFFVTAQDMIKAKYSHGYKRNKQHLRGDKVMLPATDSSTPDYEYMEQYTKNLMIRKYEQYMAFLK